MAQQLGDASIEEVELRGIDTLVKAIERVEANARSCEGSVDKAITDKTFAGQIIPDRLSQTQIPGVRITSAQEIVSRDAEVDSLKEEAAQKPNQKTTKKKSKAKSADRESKTTKKKKTG